MFGISHRSDERNWGTVFPRVNTWFDKNKKKQFHLIQLQGKRQQRNMRQ